MLIALLREDGNVELYPRRARPSNDTRQGDSITGRIRWILAGIIHDLITDEGNSRWSALRRSGYLIPGYRYVGNFVRPGGVRHPPGTLRPHADAGIELFHRGSRNRPQA